jgi:MFS family permease
MLSTAGVQPWREAQRLDGRPQHSSTQRAMSPDNAPQPANDSPPLPRTVLALGWVSLLTDVASEMIYPLLPRFIERSLRAGTLGLGLIEGLAESTSALLRLPSGAWSDRLSRRKPLIVLGYGLASIVRPLMGLAVAPWQALAIRWTDRLGKGLRSAPRDALIADVTPEAQRGRAFGFHRAMDHAGAAIGPLVAYAFLRVWPGRERELFLATMVPGAAVLVVLLVAVRERQKGRVTRVESPKPAGALRPTEPTPPPIDNRPLAVANPFHPRFRWFLAALALFVLGNSTDAFLLLRAEALDIAAADLPLLWFAFHVAKSGANLLGGRWADRIDPRRLLLVGWLIYAAVYAGFALATQAWHAVALFLVYAAYYGLAEPAEKALVARWSPVARRGAGFGWYNLVVGLGALPASVLFGWLWMSAASGPAIAFTCGAGFALLGCITLAGTFGGAEARGERPEGR